MTETQAAPDFQALLNMPAEDAVKPPAMPVGTYRSLVKGQQAVTSRDKGTPGIEFTFAQFEPQNDVDSDQ